MNEIFIGSGAISNLISFDITKPKRPKRVYLQHNDRITSIAFKHRDSVLITSSKDKKIYLRSIENCRKSQDFIKMNPCTFNNDDQIAFIFEVEEANSQLNRQKDKSGYFGIEERKWLGTEDYKDNRSDSIQLTDHNKSDQSFPFNMRLQSVSNKGSNLQFFTENN